MSSSPSPGPPALALRLVRLGPRHVPHPCASRISQRAHWCSGLFSVLTLAKLRGSVHSPPRSCAGDSGASQLLLGGRAECALQLGAQLQGGFQTPASPRAYARGLVSAPRSSSFFHFSTCQFLLSSPPSPWTDAWGREGRRKVPSL